MAIEHSAATRIEVANASVDQADTGGTLEVRDGVRPDPDSALTGQVLVSWDWAGPMFLGASDDGTFASAVALAPDTNPVAAAATGTATYCVVRKGGGGAVMWTGSVSTTGGGGDLELTSLSIVALTNITLQSLTYRAPQS